MEAVNLSHCGRHYEISYDEYGDVLYVVSPESRASTQTRTDDDGFQWRLSRNDARPSGFTVLDFNYNWQYKPDSLIQRIEKGMECNQFLARRFVEIIISVSYGRMKSDEELF